MTGPLVVVGELNVDLITLLDDAPRFGQHEQLVRATTLTMGSSSAITACGAARLGVPTELVSVRGDDPFGRYLDEVLAERGVGRDHIRVDRELPTGSSVHLSRPDGDRAILTAMGSIGTVRADDVPDQLLARAAHLHVGSYFLQEALWPDTPALFARARAAGCSVSLDGNFDPAEEWDRGIRDFLPFVDVFFGNAAEVRGITGERDDERAIQALLAAMPPEATVVFKAGADGARAISTSGRVRAAPPELPGRLVDTVGAGDSLAAGYLAGILRGLATADALALGVACGTASTRGAGGIDAQPVLEHATELARGVRID